jgi:hypothetical protein
MSNISNDTFQDMVIVCLTIVLIYLVYKKINKQRTSKKSCSMSDSELLNINSNAVQNGTHITNMSSNELVHIDDNKPYLSYDDAPINNESIHDVMQNVEQPTSEAQSFNYAKDYTNVQYYDNNAVYPSV